MRKTTISRKIVIAIIAIVMSAVLVVLVALAIAITIPLALRSGVTDFRMGFEYCCPDTAAQSNLTDTWTTDCMNQYSVFQLGYNHGNTSYYTTALLGLGMGSARFTNALFWSSNMVSDVFIIVANISDESPPSSTNIPAGLFGNCIVEYYNNPDIIQYWFEYSRLMALRASGYVFWLTSGDKTTRFFPDVDMGMMERIFGMKELPNLEPPRVPGIVVLNARSPSSKGLNCTSDIKSREKLVTINNRLDYYCCDVSLNSANVLNTINTVISGTCNSILIMITHLISQLSLILLVLLAVSRYTIPLHLSLFVITITVMCCQVTILY